MKIIGCDFHTRYQQIAMLDDETGELIRRRLEHESGEAQQFYRSLAKPVRVGVEATGPLHWFERLLAELGHELWIGDSARIRASEVRKQKTDERDAELILDLMLRDHFPRIWVPSAGERDLRQLLWHRHKMVRMRTMLGNQLHFLAMSQGLCRKKKLFSEGGRSELCSLPLGSWAARRRTELLRLLDQLNPVIDELDRAVMQEAKRREGDRYIGNSRAKAPTEIRSQTARATMAGTRGMCHGQTPIGRLAFPGNAKRLEHPWTCASANSKEHSQECVKDVLITPRKDVLAVYTGGCDSSNSKAHGCRCAPASYKNPINAWRGIGR